MYLKQYTDIHVTCFIVDNKKLHYMTIVTKYIQINNDDSYNTFHHNYYNKH